MVETSGPAVGVVVEGPGGGSGQKRAPDPRVGWRLGTWPEPSHTPSVCRRLTGKPEVIPNCLKSPLSMSRSLASSVFFLHSVIGLLLLFVVVVPRC